MRPGLKHLAALTQLESLDLSFTRVGGPGLESLAGLKHLRTLNVYECPIDDEGLTALSGTEPGSEPLT